MDRDILEENISTELNILDLPWEIIIHITSFLDHLSLNRFLISSKKLLPLKGYREHWIRECKKIDRYFITENHLIDEIVSQKEFPYDFFYDQYILLKSFS
jgi:hypothetical protein